MRSRRAAVQYCQREQEKQAIMISIVNGIEVTAFYSGETVREVLIPLMEHLAELLRESLINRRIATGVGKEAAKAFRVEGARIWMEF